MSLCVTPRVLECLSLAFALGIKTKEHDGVLDTMMAKLEHEGDYAQASQVFLLCFYLFSCFTYVPFPLRLFTYLPIYLLTHLPTHPGAAARDDAEAMLPSYHPLPPTMAGAAARDDAEADRGRPAGQGHGARQGAGLAQAPILTLPLPLTLPLTLPLPLPLTLTLTLFRCEIC